MAEGLQVARCVGSALCARNDVIHVDRPRGDRQQPASASEVFYAQGFLLVWIAAQPSLTIHEIEQ